MDSDITWKILDKYFSDNPTAFVNHHLESFNNFYGKDINQIFKEKNPIKIMKAQDSETKNFKYRANLYLGGKNGDKLYFGKPIIFDEDREHYMYPNEARLRNMTYGMTIHYDVEVEFFIEKDDGEIEERNLLLERILLGRFPIMLRSELCVLNGLDRNIRYTMGECKNDSGGYFIIDGKEKAIISQEKFANNMLYIRDKVNDLYSHSAEIRTVSEDASKPIRTLAVKIVAPSAKLTNNQIVVNVPNVRKPVPLFILMRALGIISDKSIIECCLLDLDKYSMFIDLFIPSIHDAGIIFTQEIALKYIATFTKGKTIPHVLEILSNYLLPNVGELNFRDKALFIGHMVRELLLVFNGNKKPTDRDSFKFKRVELAGELLYELFREYYTLQQRNIFQKIDKEYYYKQGAYQNNFISLIETNYREFFKDRIVENGFKKAFKGNWGSEEHTKRLGVVQDIIRLSFNSYVSIMRKINLPLDSSAKVVGPRLLHSSQWGIIDPVDTPDGGNIGLHKHMSILAKITKKCSSKPIIRWLKNNTNLKILDESEFYELDINTKIIVNGTWIGNIDEPENLMKMLLIYRRNSLISIYTSIGWDIKNNTINIFTDGGRMCHPVFYIDNKKISLDNDYILEKISNNDFTWSNLIMGFNNKKIDLDSTDCSVFNKITDLYDKSNIDELIDKQAILEYIDTSEEEGAMIAVRPEDLDNENYTHIEIHPSVLLGVMGNQIIFPENNPLPRDLFSCGQSKQAISIYHTNYDNRFDKMGVVLHYGQLPLVKSRYLKYINNEEHAYGINVIVAIACYGGYNVEDSILFNEGSLKRGLFRNTYYNTYESYEESSKVANSTVDSRFANIEKQNVVGLKPGYDYSDLDENGLIQENILVDDKKVMIGKILTNLSNPDTSLDSSVFPKKGQLGYVDKTFITEGEEGFRIAKVRIRDDRTPVIGDKFCSRCGQKGTVGLVIAEENMPFTEDGIRPDIIINPHALPSRMTIGQLLETVMGKAGCMYGSYADCTAFINRGSKYEIFGNLLSDIGFNSRSNEILYNGESGEQMKMDLFIGPTYYMRLKQLVKDKINYRARGPRTVLTRQTVQGRANDGGLRVGEMERDAIVGHGMSNFLQESLLVRGDEYFMAICNLTGMIAIYNEELNLFMSPYADGPLKFEGLLEDKIRIDKITKYGREFSIVRVPYAFKLLMQELGALNIQMRIITEDNIDQLSSMSFSGSIEDIDRPNITRRKTQKGTKIENDEESEKSLAESANETLQQTGNSIRETFKNITDNLFSQETTEKVDVKPEETSEPNLEIDDLDEIKSASIKKPISEEKEEQPKEEQPKEEPVVIDLSDMGDDKREKTILPTLTDVQEEKEGEEGSEEKVRVVTN